MDIVCHTYPQFNLLNPIFNHQIPIADAALHHWRHCTGCGVPSQPRTSYVGEGKFDSGKVLKRNHVEMDLKVNLHKFA